MPVKGTRVAVQGFGNVGSVAADLMSKEGMTIIAVSDKSGGIYNPKGLNLADVFEHVRGKKLLNSYRNAEQITNDELLTLDCDVLVPAALENVITTTRTPARSRPGSSVRAPTVPPPPRPTRS